MDQKPVNAKLKSFLPEIRPHFESSSALNEYQAPHEEAAMYNCRVHQDTQNLREQHKRTRGNRNGLKIRGTYP